MYDALKMSNQAEKGQRNKRILEDDIYSDLTDISYLVFCKELMNKTKEGRYDQLKYKKYHGDNREIRHDNVIAFPHFDLMYITISIQIFSLISASRASNNHLP